MSQLRLDIPITFSIYLFFGRSNHILLWQHPGATITKDFIDLYKKRGLNFVWIHQDDQNLFDQYSKTQVEQVVVAAPTPVQQTAALIQAAMNNKEINEEQKQVIVAQAAEDVIIEVAAAETIEEQAQLNEEAKKIVEDMIAASESAAKAIIQEIWKMANVDADLEHAVNVATYSVLFAMAFGRIDTSLLTELAMAGLLHDIGVTQVSANSSNVPWADQTPELSKAYMEHVMLGIEVIQELSPEVTDRVREIVKQHHEKFDGTGYPQKLEGFRFDDVAQLLAVAEMVDSIASGQWDGKNRTMRESYRILEGMEKNKSFPQFFNPEVFSQITQWIHTSDAHGEGKSASEVVKKEAEDMIDNAA